MKYSLITMTLALANNVVSKGSYCDQGRGQDCQQKVNDALVNISHNTTCGYNSTEEVYVVAVQDQDINKTISILNKDGIFSACNTLSYNFGFKVEVSAKQNASGFKSTANAIAAFVAAAGSIALTI